MTGGITELTADGVRTEVARVALTRRLDAFVRMYEPHEAWEDTVVFPAFREVTPDRVFAELGERFADEQRTLFGPGPLVTFSSKSPPSKRPSGSATSMRSRRPRSDRGNAACGRFD